MSGGLSVWERRQCPIIWFEFWWWAGLHLADSILPEARSGLGCRTPWSEGCYPQRTPGRPPLGRWPGQYLSRWDYGHEGGALAPLSLPKEMKIWNLMKKLLTISHVVLKSFVFIIQMNKQTRKLLNHFHQEKKKNYEKLVIKKYIYKHLW